MFFMPRVTERGERAERERERERERVGRERERESGERERERRERESLLKIPPPPPLFLDIAPISLALPIRLVLPTDRVMQNKEPPLGPPWGGSNQEPLGLRCNNLPVYNFLLP